MAGLVCSLALHPMTRPEAHCTAPIDERTCTFNGIPLCPACFAQYRIDMDACYKADSDAIKACPDCQDARARDALRIQRDHTIDPDQGYGEHITLTCRNHPHLTWSTKNIDYIGARSIFFSGFFSGLLECTCSTRHLLAVSSAELQGVH